MGPTTLGRPGPGGGPGGLGAPPGPVPPGGPMRGGGSRFGEPLIWPLAAAGGIAATRPANPTATSRRRPMCARGWQKTLSERKTAGASALGLVVEVVFFMASPLSRRDQRPCLPVGTSVPAYPVQYVLIRFSKPCQGAPCARTTSLVRCPAAQLQEPARRARSTLLACAVA